MMAKMMDNHDVLADVISSILLDERIYWYMGASVVDDDMVNDTHIMTDRNGSTLFHLATGGIGYFDPTKRSARQLTEDQLNLALLLVYRISRYFLPGELITPQSPGNFSTCPVGKWHNRTYTLTTVQCRNLRSYIESTRTRSVHVEVSYAHQISFLRSITPDCTTITIPFNHSGIHWFLLVLKKSTSSPDSWIMESYDSLNMHWNPGIEREIASIGMILTNSSTPLPLRVIPVPTQQGGIECGLHTILFAWATFLYPGIGELASFHWTTTMVSEQLYSIICRIELFLLVTLSSRDDAPFRLGAHPHTSIFDAMEKPEITSSLWDRFTSGEIGNGSYDFVIEEEIHERSKAYSRRYRGRRLEKVPLKKVDIPDEDKIIID